MYYYIYICAIYHNIYLTRPDSYITSLPSLKQLQASIPHSPGGLLEKTLGVDFCNLISQQHQ